LERIILPVDKGFTLIETMIVIAIIGILAAIAIPAYQVYIARSQITEAMSLLGTVKAGVVESYSTSAICIDNQDNIFLGIAEASDITGRYIESIQTGGAEPNCTINVKMKSVDIAKPLQGKNIIFTLMSTDNSLRWQCSSVNITALYLPASCR
jgi:type IV pilus assembly protein PilA